MNQTFHIETEAPEHSNFEATDDTLKIVFDEGNHEVVVEHGAVIFYDNLTDECYTISEEQFEVLADKWLHRRLYSGVCQVGSHEVRRRLECPVQEGGGRVCERPGEHGDEHWWSQHTIEHDRGGNGWSCSSFTKLLDYEETMKLPNKGFDPERASKEIGRMRVNVV